MSPKTITPKIQKPDKPLPRKIKSPTNHYPETSKARQTTSPKNHNPQARIPENKKNIYKNILNIY